MEFYLGITVTEQDFVFKLRDFLLVCVHTFGIVIRRRADNLQSLRLELVLQRVQSGNLFATRDAVSGPEVQQHNLSLKLLEPERLARECLKLDVRRHFEVRVLCGRRRWRLGRLEPTVQQTFRVWNPGRNLRAREERRLTT